MDKVKILVVEDEMIIADDLYTSIEMALYDSSCGLESLKSTYHQK